MKSLPTQLLYQHKKIKKRIDNLTTRLHYKKSRYFFIDIAIYSSILLFSWFLMHHSFQYADGQMIILGRIWSDFGAHIPLIRSFSLGQNFPNVEYPTFPGEPIRYHYLFFLVVGILEMLGLNIALSLNIVSALGMALLLTMIYRITLLFSKSRLAGALALILFLFNSTLSWMEVVKNSDTPGEFFKFLWTSPEFASFGPWDGKAVSAFWNWNIYINQRHLAFSLGIALFLLYPLLRAVSTKNLHRKMLQPIEFIAVYLAWITFPLLHQAGYFMTMIGAAWWLMIGCFRIPKKIMLIYVVSMGISLLTYQYLTVHPTEPPMLKLGYLATDETIWGIARYWLYNLGLYVFLVPFAWILSPRKIKLFFLPFLGFFILANTFQLSTDLINNHKLINFFIIGCNIILGIFFAKVWHWRPQYITIPIITLTLITVTFSGILDISPIVNNSKIYLDDYPKSEVGQWIMLNTPRDSVFITNHYFYNPASIVGRKIFLDYGYFNWSMGYPDGERRETLTTFYGAETSHKELCNYLKDHKLDYIYLFNALNDTEFNIKDSQVFLTFTPMYIAQEDTYIYSVASNCQEITP